MTTEPIHTDGTPFEAAQCPCGRQVVAAPGQTQARCLACAREQAGVNWESGKPIGEWHPSGGGEPPGPPPAGHTVQLMCFWCDATWPAAGGITPGWVTLAFNQHEREKHPQTMPKTSTGLRRDPGAAQ